MRHLLLVIVIWCQVTISQGQAFEHVKDMAVMLVHADHNDFYFENKENIIDTILKYYEVTILDHEEILECVFLSIKSKCVECEECAYILAYSDQEERFFRLQGFKYNEFNDFYNLVLNSGRIHLKKNNWKHIKKTVFIQHYNLEKAYAKYYKNYKASLFDETSCYRKSIIIAY